jgi:hypothetical protein
MDVTGPRRADRRRAGRVAPPMPAEVEVHVGEIVLIGFNPGDRLAIGDALSVRLQELLGGRTNPATLTAGGSHEGFRCPDYRMEAAASPTQVGDGIALAVVAGLGGDSRLAGVDAVRPRPSAAAAAGMGVPARPGTGR